MRRVCRLVASDSLASVSTPIGPGPRDRPDRPDRTVGPRAATIARGPTVRSRPNGAGTGLPGEGRQESFEGRGCLRAGLPPGGCCVPPDGHSDGHTVNWTGWPGAGDGRSLAAYLAVYREQGPDPGGWMRVNSPCPGNVLTRRDAYSD